MLVATPGQTTAYSTLHNSSGGGTAASSNNTNATVTNKKTSTTTLNSTTGISSSGTPKSLNNNNHTSSSTTGINKNSLNPNTHATTYNYQQNSSKSDNNVCTTKHTNHNNINNSNKSTTATSSRDKVGPATTLSAHSLKNENSTSITSSSKQSFIQTLKDSVQKALISTTGRNSITNNKTNNNSNNNCNNTTTTSIQNVTSSSMTTASSSHNANKVSTTTTSSTTSSNSTTAVATQSSSSSSLPLARGKYFSCSLSKLHTVAPTIIHRFPEERQHASSADSLQKEMCHFKPIRVAPTTPWKSGSKSRGNSLRFPKANLATNKTEFILKSNCDVNTKKKKQQQIRTHVEKISEDDGDKNEQENKEFYGIYKPKPSLTCLSTSFNTPNHQSAFVCLVAQMKNLVNMQSKKLLSPAKSARTIADNSVLNMEGTKTKATRSMRTIIAATSTTISNSTPMDKTVKELFVRQKQKPAKKLVQTTKTEAAKVLPKTRSTRLASNAVKNKSFSTTEATIKSKSKENIKRTNAKTYEISKLSKVSITKAKSRRNIGRAKSKMVNIVALANSSTKAKEKLQKSKSDTVAASAALTVEPRKTRKRKPTTETDIEAIPTSSSPLPPATNLSVKSNSKARKSSRLSNVKQQAVINRKQSPPTIPLKKLGKNSTTSVACFSPPLTRSRLKNLEAQGKIISTATTDIKKRRI